MSGSFETVYNDGYSLKSDRCQSLSLASSVAWDEIFFVIYIFLSQGGATSHPLHPAAENNDQSYGNSNYVTFSILGMLHWRP